MNTVDCDKCGTSFVLDDACAGMLKKDDFVVQYISCPACGTKYHILTTNSTMRNLIEQRKAVQLKIKVARAKRFKESTFKKYLREYEQIKKEQEKIFPELKAQGEKFLRGGEPGE